MKHVAIYALIARLACGCLAEEREVQVSATYGGYFEPDYIQSDVPDASDSAANWGDPDDVSDSASVGGDCDFECWEQKFESAGIATPDDIWATTTKWPTSDCSTANGSFIEAYAKSTGLYDGECQSALDCVNQRAWADVACIEATGSCIWTNLGLEGESCATCLAAFDLCIADCNSMYAASSGMCVGQYCRQAYDMCWLGEPP